ncbi:MAG: hypothetical protein SH817_06635 [Leptospira sp.]|nr:hypothetical protein [Leptospira sp.]
MKENINLINHPLFPKVISAYQISLKKRYSEESLKRYPTFDIIPRNTIELLINFFIEYLYPEYEKRLELDSAFRSLSGFVHNPAKLWGILGNLAASIFRFGRHFPAALKAGLAALHSYVTAHTFEEILIRETDVESKFGDPFADENGFLRILARIPQSDADAFRSDIGKLFRIFTDRLLVEKIILILEDVLKKMISKGKLYSEDDHRAITLGINILKEGRFIFDSLAVTQMNLIIQAIDTIEKDFFQEAKKLENKQSI